MNKVIGTLAAVLVLTFGGDIASAQNSYAWDGFYAGLGVGGASTNACNSSTLKGAAIDPSSTTFASCPSGGIVGGLQVGENFQTKRLVWGVVADLAFMSSKDNNQTVNFTGAAPPAGSYGSAGRKSPKDLAIVGARIGYAGDLMMPFVRAGGVYALGSQSSSLNYTPVGAAMPIASFSEGKNFASTGWAAGGGVEIGLNGAWSITAEYLHLSLGKGTNSTTTCAGTAVACAPFAGISLDDTHDAFTSNIFRIGINYWFNYWDKP
ncbi:MAG TPA: outer membrane beta-barrel protein [Steroidobacteraceae bacterium]|nr:outer membrane beta-barrel protein [Steroidobacteraceae bacterium]